MNVRREPHAPSENDPLTSLRLQLLSIRLTGTGIGAKGVCRTLDKQLHAKLYS